MTKTTIKNYAALALRSIKPHDNKGAALSDWALGLSGETSEVLELLLKALPTYPQGLIWDDELRMEFAKEVGDILWYTVAMMEEANVPLVFNGFDSLYCLSTKEDYTKISGLHECLSLAISVGKVSELIKHHVAHKEELDRDSLSVNLSKILEWCHLLCNFQNFDLEEAAMLNAAKLAHRYGLNEGGKFDVVASAQRHAREEKFSDTEEYLKIRDLILSGEA